MVLNDRGQVHDEVQTHDRVQALEKVLVIAGGEADIDFLKEYLKNQKISAVICADAGLDTAAALGLSVDYAMGDFDSVSPQGLEYYRKKPSVGQGTEFISYPPEKDATDLHLVLDWVVDKRPQEILIIGATGRRLDHFLASVNILMIPLEHGLPAYIIDGHNRLYLLKDSHVFRRSEVFGKYISLLPLTESVTGITLRGFKYNLENGEMRIGDSLGVSNELAEGVRQASLEVGEGILIVVESRD